MKVLIGPSSFAELDRTPLDRLLEAGYEVIDNPYKRKLTKEELLTLLSREVGGLIAGLEPLDREVLERTNLRVISRVGSGMTNVDLTAAKDLGIKVYNTPDGPTEAVAELTLGALLALMRMVPAMDRDLHDGKWNKRIGAQLQGKTVALVGYGRIGRRVAELLSPFRCEILVVDPALRGEEPGGEVTTLDEAIARADIITVHCSTEECLLGEREFSRVKPGVFLLNAARGRVFDEKALIGALDRGVVAGAWLDVFGEEPYQGPLAGYPQVVLTPHVGSYTLECRRGMETEAVDNLIQGLSESGE